MIRLRLVLADDHRLVLDGLESLLADRYDVVARVTDGHALFEAVTRHRPDLVLSDVAMPQEDGLAVSRRLLEADPQVRIVLITMNEDPYMATEALEVGVRGYVLKSEASRELFTAIETVMAGGTYTSPALSNTSSGTPSAADDPLANLTKRQLEVLRLLGRGYTMKQVAGELHISPRTVAFHKYRIMEQLGVHTNAELIRHALAIDSKRS